MIPLTRDLGAIIRWLLKGCKTQLKDEIEGNFDATWGGTYDTENYIIGIVTAIITLSLIIWLLF